MNHHPPAQIGNSLTLITSLKIEECAKRIADATDSEVFTFLSRTTPSGSFPVISDVRGSLLTLRKRPRVINPLQPLLFVKLQPSIHGTTLLIKIDEDNSPRSFMRLMVLFLSGMSVVYDNSLDCVSAQKFQQTPSFAASDYAAVHGDSDYVIQKGTSVDGSGRGRILGQVFERSVKRYGRGSV